MNWVKEYWKQIDSGKVKANEEITAVYKRLAYETEHGCGEFCFREDIGQYPIDFIQNFCRHYQGEKAGQLVVLDLFQLAFVQALYGFISKETNLRRFRESYFEVPRKHGKSFLNGCLCVYHLVADQEEGAEVYSCASKLDQAKIIFNVAKNIIDQSPELKALVKSTREGLYFKMTRSIMKPLPNESKSSDGMNISFCALDEIHSLADRNMYDVLRQGMKARKQPIMSCLTTSGWAAPGGLYESLHTYACDVAKGIKVDNRFLPIVYKLDKVEEWQDPSCWIKANPGLGTIKSYVQLADDVARAKQDASYLPTLLVKDFDMQQSENSAWLPLESIINESTIDMEHMRRSYAIGGCDLSATSDLTCATLLIRKPNDPVVYVLQHYFLPQKKIDDLELTHSKEAPYKLWADQGWLTINEGAQVSYENVTQWFVEMVRKWNIRPLWVCYDRALAGYWVESMKEYGFTMERVAQGSYTWSQPMKELGAALTDKMVCYDNNPILRWCLANTAKKSLNADGIESIMPVKIQKSRRIDGTVSLLNAWVGYVRHFNEYMPYVR